MKQIGSESSPRFYFRQKSPGDGRRWTNKWPTERVQADRTIVCEREISKWKECIQDVEMIFIVLLKLSWDSFSATFISVDVARESWSISASLPLSSTPPECH